MAVIDTSTAGAQGRPFLPSNVVYSLRVIEVSGETTKKAPPREMLVTKYEIVAPDSVQIDGKAQKITGLQLTDWIVDPSNNGKAFSNLKALTSACKGNPQVDIANPALVRGNYLGKGIRAMLRTEPNVIKTTGDDGVEMPVLDDNGQPMSDNNYRISKFIGADDRFTIPADSVAY